MAVVIDANDLGKTELELLSDLIYESEGIRIPEQKITYGVPRVLDMRPDVLDDPNTFIPIVVQADYDDRYSVVANRGLQYRRRELSSHFTNVGTIPIYVENNSFNLSDIIAQINLVLSYPLTTDDIIDQPLLASNLHTFTIQANPKSLIWINSVTVTVSTVIANRLEMLIVTDLVGFN